MILTLLYAALVAGVVFIFFRAARSRHAPRSTPFVLGALAGVLTLSAGVYDLWWLETQINYGVPE